MTSDEDLAAFQRLMRPMPGWRRWLNAVWSTGFPDYQAFQRLRARRPALYAQLPHETVEWWNRFSSQPQPSKLLLTCLFYGAAVIAFISLVVAMEKSDGPLPLLRWTLFPIVAPVLVVLLKLYVIDWPTLLIYRRWGTRFPGIVRLGWLPLCVLNIVAATWAHVAQLPTWPFALAGFLLALWTIYISGPVQVLQYASEDLDHRDLRVVFLNIIVVVWFWTMQSEPMSYRTPTIWALVLPLIAGSFARPLLMQLFSELPRATRRALLWISLLVLIEFFLLIREYARYDAAKPWLVAATLTLILFRRALPHGLLYFEFEWFGRIMFIVGLVLSGSLATQPPFSTESHSYNTPVTGMLLFVLGAVLVILAEFFEMRSENRQRR